MDDGPGPFENEVNAFKNGQTPAMEGNSQDMSKVKKPFQRRRARRACTACHERKVRCDVLQRQPCTNCDQDRCKCVVRPHKNRRASVAAMELANQPGGDFRNDEMDSPSGDASHHSTELTSEPNFLQYRPMTSQSPQTGSGQGHPYFQDGMSMRPPSNPWYDQSGMTLMPQTDMDGLLDFGGGLSFDFDPLLNADTTALTGLESVFNTTPTFAEPQTYPAYSQPSPPMSMERAESVRSPNLDYLDLTGSPVVSKSFGETEMPSTDRDYLRSQGCFQLPAVPAFYALIKAYFTFVHPNLPIINEADFWALWSDDAQSFHVGPFSVLVLQAMAFAATGFVSSEVLNQCGFQSARTARVTFHKRAKLLFDMEVERDPICMAQSALLLTYHATSYNKLRTNSLWLAHAIRFAQIARADRFYEVEQDDLKRQTALKRLWWGCITRDRILPLGLRRPIKIKDTPPISDDTRFLSEDDFKDEIGASRVHEAAVQRKLFGVINLSCRFAEAVTPGMIMMYAAEKPRERTLSTPSTLQELLANVKQHTEQLHMWHEYAIRLFPSPVSLDDEPDTVVIYANMLYIYYDAAILGLCHHACLLWETRSPKTTLNGVFFECPIQEISSAVADTTDRVRELLQMRLAQMLPISINAFLTFPLLLCVLNVKATSTEAEAALARRQLDIYTKVLKTQQKLYDGTDYVCDIIDNIYKYADEERVGLLLEHAGEGGSGTKTPTSSITSASPRPVKQSFAWRGLLLRKPRLYLRLVLHVDVAFCESSPPMEHDFPAELRRS